MSSNIPSIPSGATLYSSSGGTVSSNSFPGSAIRSTRAPTSTDIRGPQGNLPLGQVWIDYLTPAAYILGSLTTSSGVMTANWLLSALNSGDLETLTGNSGTASPVASNINIVGAGDVDVTGSGDTLTITYTAGTTGIDTINGNSGSIAPVAGEVTIEGAADTFVFTGVGDTMTVTFASELSGGPIKALDTEHATALGFGIGIGTGSPSDNTSIGYTAGAMLTGGIDCTSVGSGALAANLTGNSCTAIGKGALALNTVAANTAVGALALDANTTGLECTAVGFSALSASSADKCTGVGHSSLVLCSSGVNNTGLGASSGAFITTGTRNVAIGPNTIGHNESDNIAIGSSAMSASTAGGQTIAIGTSCLNVSGTSFNIGIGNSAGLLLTAGGSNIFIGNSCTGAMTGGSSNVVIGTLSGSAYTTTESNNILIGTSLTGVVGESNVIRIGEGSTTCFIRGIRGVTTADADAIPVLISSVSQLGTVSSSRRFKENIRDLDSSERIYDLRPVTFKYKSQESTRPQFGLIAEEVHDVIPEIVVHDKEGKFETIQYQTLPIFLLAEIQKLKKEIDALKAGR